MTAVEPVVRDVWAPGCALAYVIDPSDVWGGEWVYDEEALAEAEQRGAVVYRSEPWDPDSTDERRLRRVEGTVPLALFLALSAQVESLSRRFFQLERDVHLSSAMLKTAAEALAGDFGRDSAA